MEKRELFQMMLGVFGTIDVDSLKEQLPDGKGQSPDIIIILP